MNLRQIVVSAGALLVVPSHLWAQGAAGPDGAENKVDLEAESQGAVGYDRGFFIADGDDFKLVVQGRVQGRFELESLDEDGDRNTEENLQLSRARLTLKGHAFSPDIGYKLQADFGKGSVVLKDFFVDYHVAPSPVRVRVGQFKRPFSRQQINSSGRLEMVDRNITDKAFGNGRDIGVAVHNRFEKSPEVEWVVGVFNGTGDKGQLSGDVMVDPMDGMGEITGGSFSNVPDEMHPTIVARAGYNHGGIAGYSEADFEGGPLRFAVAAAGLADFDNDGDDQSSLRGGLDFALKVQGLSTTGGIFVASIQDGTAFSDQSYAQLGAFTQLGYLIREKFQPAIRYALVAPDGGDNDMHEITGAFSLYAFAHNFKWQTDVAALIGERAGATTRDLRVRSQLQLSF